MSYKPNNYNFKSTTNKKNKKQYDVEAWSPNNLKKAYHQQRLDQSKWAFRLSFCGSIVGFVVIIATVVFGLATDSSEWPGIVSGIIIEAVSALFYELSNRANKKITEFFAELTKEANVNTAVKMCDQVKDDAVRDKLITDLSLKLSDIEDKNE